MIIKKIFNLMKLFLNKKNKQKEIKIKKFFDYCDGFGHGNGYDDAYGLGNGHGVNFHDGVGYLDGTGRG
jgi:hypothetical protein